MSTRPAAIIGFLLGLALVLSACGDGGTVSAGGKAEASGASVARTTASEASGRRPMVPLTARRCRRRLGDLLDSIESLSNTLAVGLDYDDYLATVNRVRATYANVPADRLPLACLGRVAGPTEGALNAYIDAVNAWGECLATPSCNTQSVEPRLQRRWERAGELVASARRGLRAISR